MSRSALYDRLPPLLDPYNPYPPRFRLLTLLPFPPNAPSAPVITTLSTHPIPFFSDPSHYILYQALSYSWGSSYSPSASTSTIQCNDIPFSVTATLFDGLTRLRLPSTPRILWIDAICINQDNLLERAQQVDLMGEIYQGAGRVLVWLGSPRGVSPSSWEGAGGGIQIFERVARQAVELMDEEDACRVAEGSKQYGEDWVGESLSESKRRLVELWEALGKTGEMAPPPLPRLGVVGATGKKREPIVLGDEEMKAVEQVLSQPWWTRSWVVQEICLAREAVMVWGDVHLHWDAMSMALLTMNIDPGVDDGPSPGTLNVVISAIAVARMRAKLKHGKSVVNFVDLLRGFRHFQATDPRDKVYAFLGLMAPADPLRGHLRANYEIDVVECYRQTALSILSSMKDLDLLALERYPGSGLSSSLPSWVPDWTCSNPRTVDFPLAPVAKDGQPTPQPFSASGPNNTFTVSTRPNFPNHLVLSGFIIDTLTQVADPLPFPFTIESASPVNPGTSTLLAELKSLKLYTQNTGHFFDTLLQWERFACRNHTSTPTTGTFSGEKHPLVAFMTTLCMGSNDNDADTSTIQHSWATETKGPRRFSKLRILGARHILRRGWYHTLMGLAGSWTHSPEGQEMITQITVCVSRRLARTEKGRLAVVPASARVGDCVALCRGGRVPLLLRGLTEEEGEKAVRRWELMGCGYVYGIMYGEAWKDEGACEEIVIV
ncbi:Heterokaryon incompatibility protein (HET) domain containing protein [Rhypophila decipiens]